MEIDLNPDDAEDGEEDGAWRCVDMDKLPLDPLPAPMQEERATDPRTISLISLINLSSWLLTLDAEDEEDVLDMDTLLLLAPLPLLLLLIGLLS